MITWNYTKNFYQHHERNRTTKINNHRLSTRGAASTFTPREAATFTLANSPLLCTSYSCTSKTFPNYFSDFVEDKNDLLHTRRYERDRCRCSHRYLFHAFC